MDRDFRTIMTPDASLAESWMARALEMARQAAAADEVPVGAVVIRLSDGKIVGQAHDEKMGLNDPTAHAEILALRRAGIEVGDWRLEGCALVVTLEPCAMCAGATLLARVPLLIYGTESPKFGAVNSRMHILNDAEWNHRVTVINGICAEECSRVMAEYFRGKRRGI